MSVSSELSRLQAAKADLTAALAEKGVAVPEGSTLDTFGGLVRQVKTGATVSATEFSAAQWTGSADPYTLTIPATDREGATPLLYQVECLSGGIYQAAGYFAIDEIVRQDAARKAGENGDKLCAGIQKLIDKYDLPFVTWNTGSIVHFEVSGVMYLSVTDPDIFTKIPERQKYIEEFGAALTANGVITLAGSRIYTSMADNDDTIAQTLNAFEDVFSNVER